MHLKKANLLSMADSLHLVFSANWAAPYLYRVTSLLLLHQYLLHLQLWLKVLILLWHHTTILNHCWRRRRLLGRFHGTLGRHLVSAWYPMGLQLSVLLEFEIAFGDVAHEQGLKLAVVFGELRWSTVLSGLILSIMIIIDRSENRVGHQGGPVIAASAALMKDYPVYGS